MRRILGSHSILIFSLFPSQNGLILFGESWVLCNFSSKNSLVYGFSTFKSFNVILLIIFTVLSIEHLSDKEFTGTA